MNTNMIRAIALPIAFSVVPYASASDYFCRSAFDTKLERIENNRGSRDVSRIAGVVASASVVAGSGIVLISSGAIGVVMGVVVGGISGATLGGGIVNLFDREIGLLDAKTLLDQAMMSREDLHQALYDRYIEEKMEDSKLSRADAEAKIGPIGKLNLYSSMDLAFIAVNADQRDKGMPGFTYAQFQEKVQKLMDTDLFCPMRSGKNRPMTYRKVVKLIKDN